MESGSGARVIVLGGEHLGGALRTSEGGDGGEKKERSPRRVGHGVYLGSTELLAMRRRAVRLGMKK